MTTWKLGILIGIACFCLPYSFKITLWHNFLRKKMTFAAKLVEKRRKQFAGDFHWTVVCNLIAGGKRTLDTKRLLSWYQEKLKPHNNKVTVIDLTSSWKDGVALCCLIHLYRPEIMWVPRQRFCGKNVVWFQNKNDVFCFFRTPSSMRSVTKQTDFFFRFHAEIWEESILTTQWATISWWDFGPIHCHCHFTHTEFLSEDKVVTVRNCEDNNVWVVAGLWNYPTRVRHHASSEPSRNCSWWSGQIGDAVLPHPSPGSAATGNTRDYRYRNTRPSRGSGVRPWLFWDQGGILPNKGVSALFSSLHPDPHSLLCWQKNGLVVILRSQGVPKFSATMLSVWDFRRAPEASSQTRLVEEKSFIRRHAAYSVQEEKETGNIGLLHRISPELYIDKWQRRTTTEQKIFISVVILASQTAYPSDEWPSPSAKIPNSPNGRAASREENFLENQHSGQVQRTGNRIQTNNPIWAGCAICKSFQRSQFSQSSQDLSFLESNQSMPKSSLLLRLISVQEELRIPDTRTPSTDCCICGRRLLVVERQSAHGYFFHRPCFRCATCGCSLWLGSSSARPGINDKGAQKKVVFITAKAFSLVARCPSCSLARLPLERIFAVSKQTDLHMKD